MRTIKKEPKKAEDLTSEERRHLIKKAVEVKVPEDILLKGKEAIKRKNRGKEVKGEFNWRLSPKDPLILR